MTPTHGDVLAAIDKARDKHQLTSTVAYGERHEHCHDLRATAERHTPFADVLGIEQCQFCSTPEMYESWPCPDYQQVIDRLTGWGVL